MSEHNGAAFTFHVSHFPNDGTRVLHSIPSFFLMRILLTAIHGIFTGQTDPSWPDNVYFRQRGLEVLGDPALVEKVCRVLNG